MGLGNWRHIEKKHICQGPFSLDNPCEVGRLCLDPNSPFIWFKIRIFHLLSGNGLNDGSKRIFEGSFLHVPALFTVLKINWNCSQFSVILHLYFSSLLFHLHSFLLLLPASQHWHTKKQNEAVFFSKYQGTKYNVEKQLSFPIFPFS